MNTWLDSILVKVDELTKHTHRKFTWVDDDGHNQSTTVEQIPLITWLRQAVVSSIGAESHGGTLKSTRNVLNVEAFQLYDIVETTSIKLLGEVSSAIPFLTPEENLRQWFMGFRKQVMDQKASDELVLAKLTLVSKLVSGIEDLIWPPTTLEITSKCPECGERFAKTKDGDQGAAIVVTYRPPSNASKNALSRSQAVCRACHQVWRGDTKLRELRFALDVVDSLTVEEIVKINV